MISEQKDLRFELLAAIEHGIIAARGKCRSLIGVLPFSVSAIQISSMLKLPGVAGLMVPSSSSAQPFGSVGVVPDYGDWVLPSVSAEGLLLLADPASLAVVWWRTALRAGMRYCVFMAPDGQWVVRSIQAEFIRQLCRRVFIRGRDYLAGNPEAWLEASLLKHFGNCTRVSEPRLFDGVIHVAASLGAGGAERQLVRLCNEQVRAGIPVLLLLSSNNRQARGEFFANELAREVRLDCLRSLPELLAGSSGEDRAVWEWHCRDGAERLLAKLPSSFAEMVRRFRATFLILRPAVVHLWQDEINVLAGLGALLAGVPRIVLGQRSLAPWRFSSYSALLRPVYRFLASQNQVVILNNSEAGALDYAKWLDLPRGRILTIANAADAKLVPPSRIALAAWRAEHGVPSIGPVIGGIFRLMEVKDPLLWLATVAEVAKHHASAHFLLVGDGVLHRAVADQIKRLGIDGRISWVPSEKDVSFPLASMDIFLLTSRSEGTPNVLIEAGLIGCAVVSTDVGGCSEVVQSGINGWLVNDRSVAALAGKILAALSDPDALENIRQQAPLLIRRQFSTEQMLKKTLAAYGMETASGPSMGEGKVNVLEGE